MIRRLPQLESGDYAPPSSCEFLGGVVDFFTGGSDTTVSAAQNVDVDVAVEVNPDIDIGVDLTPVADAVADISATNIALIDQLGQAGTQQSENLQTAIIGQSNALLTLADAERLSAEAEVDALRDIASSAGEKLLLLGAAVAAFFIWRSAKV